MKALRSFTVRPKLPEALAPLHELAMNLRWSWDARTRDLFRWVEPAMWDQTGHDPVRLLGVVGTERLETLAADPAFMGFLGEVHADLRRHLEASLWFQGREGGSLREVAYFSPEFGIAEALPQYSGGLGVLAGDHLKAATALGLPLVGVGLFYRQGYFRQALNPDGWQQERYPTLDPHAMALDLVDQARVQVELAGTPLVAQVWRAQVGRVPLYLLDADVDDNDPEERHVTDRLYAGASEHRLRQEILLGMGGVRALEALGLPTQVFHTNEGHAGFLGLERIRRLVTQEGLSFPEAVEAVRAATIFTTHTPVSAGIDRFPRELMERYFKGWAAECGVAFDQLMELGHFPGEAPDDPFNMAVMGLRLAGMSNGVSRLHAHVSRTMFRGLWPELPVEEVPITGVTNGVHHATWVAPEMDDLLTRYVLPNWSEAGPADWERVDAARDDELWRAREQTRERLVGFVRARLRSSLLARGVSESDTAWCEEVLDPRILTIGFARRFAAYKRATLLLSQPERLKALLLSTDRPVQLVFAGKAHPADDVGKEMIRQIVQFSRDVEVRHRMTFVEDYDIAVARLLYQGCDVWLNTPRRPQEACGTSGEKAALNGSLNCSILDGWWDELFNGENGWAVTSAEAETDLGKRDEVEAASAFDILERQVVPLFYDRFEGPVPRRWLRRVKSSLRSLGPQVVATRMVRDYVEHLYEPAAARAERLSASGYGRARALAEWKERVTAGWPAVRVRTVESEVAPADLGAERKVWAEVTLGELTDADVSVQLVHGAVGPSDELAGAQTAAMRLDGPGERRGESRYQGAFSCSQAGRYGFTVRIVPSHADLATPAETGCVTWA
ncbi:MAG: glycosyltransferase family 1 protein [Actinobacteria bacterium]|nr:MAG: glycosyltransferase family 1 protein [Actinomycetota bacterium]